MISDNTAEVPDAKKPRLDLPPPPPVPPAPPAPPPAPVHNGSYGTQDLIAQMTARGVAKAPGAGPPGPGNMGPLGPSNVGGMLGPMMPMAHQMPMMQACRPMVPQAHACMLPLPGPPATGKPIFLAAATAHIKPKSSKPGKQLAMEFVQSSKEKQAEMLKDPNVARAILQTLEGSQGGASVTPLGALDAGNHIPEAKDALWAGVLTLARNGAKRLPARVTLHRGKVQEIEVAVRSAAQHTPAMLDIKHRVPFDDAARRIKGGSVLSLDPITPTDQKSFDEYIKYFKTKSRAGVARLDGNLALYLLPAGESPEVLKALYELNTHIPRNGSLLGIIGESGPVAAPGAAAVPKETTKAKAEEEKPEKEQPKEGDDEAPNMSSKELMDLFTNPDLIAALLNDKEKTEGK